jgi:radical SAM superfamily enzyme YgiQ (UPF0313 family)
MPWTCKHDDFTPLGHASLVSSLKQNGSLNVEEIIQPVCDGEFLAEDLSKQVMTLAYGIPSENIDLGVGVYVWNDKQVKELLRSLRANSFQGRIILGGPQITYAGVGLERIYPEADIFIRGYSEKALCEVTQSYACPQIRGVHYADDDDLCLQAATNLEALPSPWLDKSTQLHKKSSVRWETQRGCPFRCSFCQHRQPDARIPIAIIEESRINSEIALFCESKIRRISILDPVFNMNPNHALRILKQFSLHNFQGEIALQCRAEMVDENFLDAVQKLNVTLEFGLQSIHKKEYLAAGRPNNMKKVEKVLRDVQLRKIKNEVSLIYGLPEQTLESFQSSVEWCLRMSIPVIKAYPLLLLRGTELERQQEQWSYVIKEGDFPMVVSSNSFNLSEFDAMEKIANALSKTEYKHPQSLQELMNSNEHVGYSSNASRLRALGKGL